MYSNHQAIVLHSFPYTESKRIIHCYTKDSGRQSFMLYVKQNSKSKGNLSQYQPFSMIEVETRGVQDKKMATIKNAKPIHHFTSFPFDPIKQMQVLFMAELCYSVLQKETDNSDLYHFIEYTILFLDTAENGTWVHVKFMMELCTYLGFKLNVQSFSEPEYFNPFSGCIQNFSNAETCSSEITDCIKLLATHSLVDLENYTRSKKLLPDIINTLITYYKHHITGFKSLKTVDYFRRV